MSVRQLRLHEAAGKRLQQQRKSFLNKLEDANWR